MDSKEKESVNIDKDSSQMIDTVDTVTVQETFCGQHEATEIFVS